MKHMADTLKIQVTIHNISLTPRMRQHDVSRCAERRHKMGTNETISPCHENAFALKIHHLREWGIADCEWRIAEL
jgi:hypothetical protein